MVIAYKGRVESLRREFESVRPRLDEQYLKIFGQQRVEKIKEVARRTLDEDAFFDDVGALNKRLGSSMPSTSSNKMIICTNDVAMEAKSSENWKIRTAPLFYISQAAMGHSHYEKLLSSATHEFNHFAWYALQKIPYILTFMMVGRKFKSDMRASGSALGWASEMAKKMIDQKGVGSGEKFSNAMYFVYANVFKEHHECSNQILDRMVLGGIGIDVPLEWRGKPREYLEFDIPGRIKLRVPVGGDPYLKLSDEEVVESMLDWENRSQFMLENEEMTRFMDALKRSRISRMPYAHLERLEKGQPSAGIASKA
jgi:hypothetical protein